MRRRTNTGPQIVTLVLLAAALVSVIVLKAQCGKAVGGYFETLEQPVQSDR